MDELALRNQLNNLDALRSSLHSSLRFWEWVVVVGLVVDAIVILKEFWDDWQDFRRGTIHSPERPKISLLFMALLGTGLIAFGIARELSIDAKIEGVETQIRGVNEQLYGIVSDSAKTAHEEADAVKKETDALKKDLTAASSELDSIEYRTLLLGPREKLLSGKRRQKLVDALMPFAGAKIDIGLMALLTTIQGFPNPTPSDFKERDGLARSLIGVLNDAHWNAPKGLPNKASTLGGSGISVHLFPGAPLSTREAAEVLADALRKVPLATIGPISDLTTTEEPDKSAIVLVVHLR